MVNFKRIVWIMLMIIIVISLSYNVKGELLQNYNGTAGGLFSFGYATNNQAWAYECFQANNTYQLTNISTSLEKVGTPTNNVTMELWTQSGTSPSAVINVSPTKLNGASITGSFVYYNFDFKDSIIGINTSQFYCIVMKSSSYSTSNYYHIDHSTNGGGTDDVGSGTTAPVWTGASTTSKPALRIYGFVPPNLTDVKYYNVNTSQSPPDINTSVIEINVTANITSNNTNLTASGTANIYYRPVTSLNNGCSIFYGTLCNADNTTYKVYNMTRIDNSTFYKELEDTDIYPAYYPFNYEFINSNLGANFTNYQNNNIRFNIFNFSTSTDYMFLDLEMDAVNESSSTASMIIYYCNSSYTSNSPLLSPNCEVIGTYLPQSWSHSHNFSRHGVLPFQVRNITKTKNSSIIMVSPNVLQANGWRFRYVTNNSYNNKSFFVGNPNNWEVTNKIFDIHIHNYKPTDYLEYYVMYNDGNSTNVTTQNSNVIRDYYNITQYPPTTPLILSPCGQTFTFDNSNGATNNENITINWTGSSDENNDSILYGSRIESIFYDDTICDQTTALSCITDTSNLGLNELSLSGTYQYFAQVFVTDGINAPVYSDESCIFYVCISEWIKTIQACSGGVRIIDYDDTYNCPTIYNLPVSNNTFEACTELVYNEVTLDYELTFIIIIFSLLIISLICALFVHEGFFGMCAVLLGILGIGFYMFEYNDMLSVACGIMALLFVFMWIMIRRNR